MKVSNEIRGWLLVFGISIIFLMIIPIYEVIVIIPFLFESNSSVISVLVYILSIAKNIILLYLYMRLEFLLIKIRINTVDKIRKLLFVTLTFSVFDKVISSILLWETPFLVFFYIELIVILVFSIIWLNYFKVLKEWKI